MEERVQIVSEFKSCFFAQGKNSGFATSMILAGLQKTTLIDFPGRIACTVFLSGCNFRCPFCYSPELVLPEKIARHPEIPQKYFFAFLEKRKGLLEGVAICGGEPTINKDLPDFCRKIKGLGFLLKLDTNGSNPAMVKDLFKSNLIDYVAMDVKQIQNSKLPEAEQVRYGAGKSQKYNEAIGVKIDLDKIKESVEIIKNSGVDYEFRTTVVPTVHTKEDIAGIAEWLAPAKKYCLQNFRPEKNLNPAFKKLRPYPAEWLSGVKKDIEGLFEVCEIR